MSFFFINFFVLGDLAQLELEKLSLKKKLHLQYSRVLDSADGIKQFRQEARKELIKLFEAKFKMMGKDPEIYAYCLEDNLNSLYKEPSLYKVVILRLFSYLKVKIKD